MKSRKERLTVTVDGALLRAANEAVAAGRADSLSGWVNLALAERAAKERRLLAMSDAVAAYEARYGAISDRELAEQARIDRRASTVTDRARVSGRRRRRSA